MKQEQLFMILGVHLIWTSCLIILVTSQPHNNRINQTESLDTQLTVHSNGHNSGDVELDDDNMVTSFKGCVNKCEKVKKNDGSGLQMVDISFSCRKECVADPHSYDDKDDGRKGDGEDNDNKNQGKGNGNGNNGHPNPNANPNANNDDVADSIVG